MRSQEASGQQIQNSWPDFGFFFLIDQLKSKDVPEAMADTGALVESLLVRGKSEAENGQLAAK